MLEWQIADLIATDRHLVRVTNYKTMQCAVTAWQLTDWTFEDLPSQFRAKWQLRQSPTDSQLVLFQNWSRSACRALKICREIANAFKHRTLRNDRHPSITSDTMIHLDEYFQLLPQLVLTLDGFVLPPADVMREAHAFWAECLGDAGLLTRSDLALRLTGLELHPGGWNLAVPAA